MLEKRDLILAFALHVLVVAVIATLQAWQTERKPIPERLIRVNMVSLKTLQAMMQKPEVKTKNKPKIKPKAKLKTKPKAKQKTKPRPTPKPRKKPKVALVAKPSPKPKKKKVIEEPDYDPFTPLESAPEPQEKSAPKPKTNSKQVLQDLLQGQLSEQELNRYILGMQKAVERQWKVPMEMMDKVKPALVSLTLAPTGDVLKVTILESSGSAMLDDSLRKAIYAAAPFELPAKQFELFKNNTIRFYPIE
ncbi:TonB family protein [Ghiorsea bivora]|uniref:TonB family protein n=1 Tax=Ghiorsea bivora TaxID=1485545 RepID=UPI00068CA7B6|nr:TonB family protein [Ghiorsea bivora]